MDPRGPDRAITKVSETVHGRVTLSCGHVRHFNPIYSYRVGERANCLLCLCECPRGAGHMILCPVPRAQENE